MIWYKPLRRIEIVLKISGEKGTIVTSYISCLRKSLCLLFTKVSGVRVEVGDLGDIRGPNQSFRKSPNLSDPKMADFDFNTNIGG